MRYGYNELDGPSYRRWYIPLTHGACLGHVPWVYFRLESSIEMGQSIVAGDDTSDAVILVVF